MLFCLCVVALRGMLKCVIVYFLGFWGSLSDIPEQIWSLLMPSSTKLLHL